MKPREERTFTARELRAEMDGDKPKIRGYAAVFGSWSENLGGFREIIRPGAFAKTIREADVRALYNHDANLVLGRTKSGTLRLIEDEVGLRIEVDPPDTQYARDLMTSIGRGDVDQMSFGFRVIKDEWRTDLKPAERELIEVALYDVSPVTFPAYPATSVNVRELMPEEPPQAGHSGGNQPNAESETQAGDLEVVRARLKLLEVL